MIKINNNFELKKCCYVNTNLENDRFVGIKIDTGEIKVCFPIGYQLPESENDIKKDILHLIHILSEFSNKEEGVLVKRKYAAKRNVNFPINSYLEVIQYFIENNGYYSEKNSIYKTKKCGNINWLKTIKNQRPSIFFNKIPIYTNYTVRESTLNYNKLITDINKYCVYESFSKLGWIFTTYMPEKPNISIDKKRFIIAINDKLLSTNNDKEKILFSAMIDILEYIDENLEEHDFYYGTNKFEVVWEKLVDSAFGIKNKQKYFPKTKWILGYNKNRINHNLEPDTIMIYNSKIYILDAKYYKYGITGNLNDLPDSSSINKQITYGEYAYYKFDLNDENLYNAFIMPYNANKNPFGLNFNFVSIGEALGDWKENKLNYERIQGILVDTRFLMYNYIGKSETNIIKLAETIENSLIYNKSYTGK